VIGLTWDGERFGDPVVRAGGRNPSFLTASRDGALLHAVFEVDDVEGSGGVASYRLDPAAESLAPLEPLSVVSSGGADPAHIALSPDGRTIAVGNYGAGSVSLHHLRPDGSADQAFQLIQHPMPARQGSDPGGRQQGPHVHQVVFDPFSDFLAVVDLGLDRVFFSAFDERGRAQQRTALELREGSGPRHLVFHPGGRHLLVACELSGEVVVAVRVGEAFEIVDVVSMLEMFSTPVGTRLGAIRCTPDGAHVLVSNRAAGADAVHVLGFEAARGLLTARETLPIPGSEPRDLIVLDDGVTVVAALQGADAVAALSLDPRTGRLTPMGRAMVPAPASVLQVRDGSPA
jgi:6-phosphogluconolactonase